MTRTITRLNALRTAIRALLIAHDSQVDTHRANIARRRRSRKLIKNRKVAKFYKHRLNKRRSGIKKSDACALN